MPRQKPLIVVTKMTTKAAEAMFGQPQVAPGQESAPSDGNALSQQDQPAGGNGPQERPAVKAGREAKPLSISAPRGSKEAGEALLRATAEHLDRIFPLEQRNELLAELAVLPAGTPEDQISARLNCVRYANELSGIVTIAQAKQAEAGALLPVIKAAGPPSDEPWKAPERSTPEEAARAVVAQARPMDGYQPPPKPVPVLKPAFTVKDGNGNGDHA